MRLGFSKRAMLTWVIVILLGLAASIAGGIVGFSIGHEMGQVSVVDYIAYDERVMLYLSSMEVQAELKDMFPERLNFTELLVWESSRLNYSEAIEHHSDPLEILDYGKGRCGEFAILYAAVCLANNVSARLCVPGYMIPNVVDHAWVEVNPSGDGETWIHVEVTDSCVAIQNGQKISELKTIDNFSYYAKRNYRMVLAFQLDPINQVVIIDRTSVYAPNS